MKWLKKWQTYAIVGIILSIYLLYAVLKVDYMSLPDSGLSRGIEIKNYPAGSDFSDFYTKTYSVTSDSDKLYALSISSEGLNLDVLGPSLEVYETHFFEALKGHYEIASKKQGDYLTISCFDPKTNRLEFYALNLMDHSLKLESNYTLSDVRAWALTPDALIYTDEGHLIRQTQSAKTELASSRFSESIAILNLENSNEQLIGFTQFIDSQYQLDLVKIDQNGKVLNYIPNYFVFGASGAVKPTELELGISGDKLNIISVIKDSKSGVNIVYWLNSNLTASKAVDFKTFNAYTYSLSPLFYLDDRAKLQLIMTARTSIGRVELGSEGSFQNLISTDDTLSEAKSMTKSTRPAINPQWLEIDKNHYLFYTQTEKGMSHLMVASDKAQLIELSQKASFGEMISLLMTTLTTFLPLMYVSLIIEVYVLTPVLIAVVFISMFKLTWAERHGKEMLLISLGLHLATKIYFIYQYVIVNQALMGNLPNFLNSPLKFLFWATVMTGLSIASFRAFHKAAPNRHYLQQYIFFNLIDIILFTMLYAPYYLLQ